MGDGEKIQVSTFRSPQVLVRLHPFHGRVLASNQQQMLRFACGIHTTKVPYVLDPTVPIDRILLSHQASKQILLNASPNWVSASIQAEGITLGPTIGILCNPVWSTKFNNLRRTTQSLALEKLVESGQELGALVFLFRLEDVDFVGFRVKGYVRDKNAWMSVVMPLPEVIYDQVISRKIERSKKYKDKRIRLSKLYGTKIFNDGFFDKWQVHQWLMNDRRTRRYVPPTVRHTRIQSDINFMRKYDTVFLKPVHGSLGLGIVKVIRSTEGGVVYEVKRQNTRVHGNAKNLEAAMQILRSRLNARPYLIQRGIALAKYRDQTFDIRTVLQRDGSGEWKRTKMFARVARHGDFTSNLSSGGEAMPVGQVLSEIFASDDRRRKVKQVLRRVSLLVAETLEEQSGKTFGELGIDLGIDAQGNPWIIEVNSKPWKSATTEKGRQDLVDLAFLRPMQYALRLANQK